MSNYEGGFTEHDITLLYAEAVGRRYSLKVISRYRTTNGYMALVYIHNQYVLFFVSSDIIQENECYLQHQIVTLAISISEKGAIEETRDIAFIVGATELGA